MTPRCRAEFDRHLAALRSGDFPALVLADWLEEHEADLACWCLAWRDCPEPADAFQAHWAAWLREREPAAQTVPALGVVSPTSGKHYGYHPPRYLAVRGYRVVMDGNAYDFYWYVASAGYDGGPHYADPVQARRDRKRRVLALFPEVECVIRRPIPDTLTTEEAGASVLEAAIAGTLGLAGNVAVEGRWLVQTVRAPDLIPPEADSLPRPAHLA